MKNGTTGNATLRSAIEEAVGFRGHGALTTFARSNGIRITTLNSIVCDRDKPILLDGSIRKSAADVMAALCALPQDLWPDDILWGTRRPHQVFDEGIERLTLEDPQEAVSRKQELACVEALLNSCLTRRQSKVIQMRMGLYAEPMTLDEVGRVLDLTRERVRQIEAEASRSIRRVFQNGSLSVRWNGDAKTKRLLDGWLRLKHCEHYPERELERRTLDHDVALASLQAALYRQREADREHLEAEQAMRLAAADKRTTLLRNRPIRPAAPPPPPPPAPQRHSDAAPARAVSVLDELRARKEMAEFKRVVGHWPLRLHRTKLPNIWAEFREDSGALVIDVSDEHSCMRWLDSDRSSGPRRFTDLINVLNQARLAAGLTQFELTPTRRWATEKAA